MTLFGLIVVIQLFQEHLVLALNIQEELVGVMVAGGHYLVGVPVVVVAEVLVLVHLDKLLSAPLDVDRATLGRSQVELRQLHGLIQRGERSLLL